MAINIRTRIDVSGPAGDLAEIGRRIRSPRPLLRAVAILGMDSATVRLNDVLGKKSKDAVRTGRLAASLMIGDADSVFELGEYQVEFGSNLPYAAQVQYGGTIMPREAKALAIPIPVELKRSRLWPKDFEEGILQFLPYTGSKPNVFGLLFDPEGELGYGKGPLYALAYWVTQEPKPFLYFSDEDVRIINEELWPKFLGMSPA